jgi:hypothetical protein
MNDHGGNAVYIRYLLCCVVVCSITGSKLVAQESSSWWPFGASEKTETRSSSYFGSSKPKATTSSSKDSWFKWPSWSSKSKPKSKSSSMVSRAGKTSKRWWDNTVDFMNPFNDSKPAQTHGYQSDYWSSRNKPKEEKSSGMFGWMWQEEKQELSTVNDFLALPPPEY